MINTHGCIETNPLSAEDKSVRMERNKRMVSWKTKGLKVTRLRLLSDPGLNFWDVSYCEGMLDDEPVKVDLPFFQLPKRGFKRAIVAYAKKDGVYAHGIGVLANISTLC